MGNIFTENEYLKNNSTSVLKILCDVSYDSNMAIDLNIPIAKMLKIIREKRRGARLERCIIDVLAANPEKNIVTGIDVLMNPSYEVDIIRSFININKNIPVSIVWPGYYHNRSLIYAQEGCLDYKVFNVDSYDIICVVKEGAK